MKAKGGRQMRTNSILLILMAAASISAAACKTSSPTGLNGETTGGDIKCNADPQQFPEFDRTCAVDGDETDRDDGCPA